ncbi:thioesterase superfamily protein [Eremomyces bilateralis CBS 781.70]|uniref:Thioesterase superfamily protein n=1 Tax=Eremomyces bilateralis CBS 781.70 TaxID=1392243 RepID=A0A6G1G677_9PEZI|nr:thioesterase superfamily protein [Eremomyces bilateralis CBS 781.70]KAF1813544.1 thioesterase superfamily protein [Eremomyces bilateralis CBS 781.70]
MEDEAKFASIPWVSKLIQDPQWVSVTTPSRIPKPTGEDSFFAKLLNSPTTIPGYLSQYRRPDTAIAHGAPISNDGSKHEPAQISEVRTFVTLMKDLAGHPNLTHGGIIASVFDEVMGVMIMIRLQGGKPEHMDVGGGGLFTAYMNVQYLRPVPLGGAVMVVAWVKKVTEGRKFWIESEMRDEAGTVLATGETLYVKAKAKAKM